ncbi:CBS domain-containing protein [Frankia sp. AiPs1]|uniref:CBS domain-containing protein n=1 Tax=Frankia sp. AiPa1 TaxID=573492 RepID=UPI00202B8FC9|nr:CBS domain-containing protein [Frankia sp. AiPa1]MCL9762638.1 CBS domain-containing protein [Frankia sp. AiPa1]
MIDQSALRALRDTELTIRALLDLWGYRVRDAGSVARIRFDLERVGLLTDPPFDVGPMDTTVRVVPFASPGAESADPGASGGARGARRARGAGREEEAGGRQEGKGQAGQESTAESDGEMPQDDAAEELPAAAMRVDDLSSARGPVVCVRPGDSVTYATTQMMKLDYSQIPVLEGDSSLYGVVTWQSVARMYANQTEKTLANAMDPPAAVTVVHTGDNLLTTLPIIAACDYVLVRNQHGHICGIVTTADIAVQFGNVARPFFVIGEIERRLRSFLTPVFDRDPAVRKATRKKTDRVSGMMFGDYVELLKDPANWQRLGWPFVDRDLFIELLDGVRMVRNAVAHFRPMTLTATENQQVDQLLLMLKSIGP